MAEPGETSTHQGWRTHDDPRKGTGESYRRRGQVTVKAPLRVLDSLCVGCICLTPSECVPGVCAGDGHDRLILRSASLPFPFRAVADDEARGEGPVLVPDGGERAMLHARDQSNRCAGEICCRGSLTNPLQCSQETARARTNLLQGGPRKSIYVRNLRPQDWAALPRRSAHPDGCAEKGSINRN